MQSLEELNNLTDSELLDRLGRDLYGEGGLGVGGDESGRRHRLARQWVTDKTEEFKQQVCGDGALLRVVESEQANRIAEIAIVADALAGVFGKPTANIVAVILVRRGIAALCR